MMSFWRKFLPAFGLLVALWNPAASEVEIPFLAGRVNDAAGMLSLETVQRLNGMLKSHEDSTSNQVVVLTMGSLEGEDLEGYSIRVVDTWKLGRKGKDNGVLFLVVRDDRKVRIEVGRGLEGNLPDIVCGSIIRNEVLPRFKAGDMDGGIFAGSEAILNAIRGAYEPDRADESSDDLPGRLMGFVIFLAVVGVFTAVGLFTQGFASWFLYVFLMPFWFLFPAATLGLMPGTGLFGLFLVGYPLFKFWLKRSPKGKKLLSRASSSLRTSSAGGSRWSSSGSSGGGSSGGFSGGGGSFSGGGASGSW